MSFRALVIAFATLAVTAGAAIDEACAADDDGFEVEDAFGFTDGAATVGEGDWEAGSAVEGRWGKRSGAYRAFSSETEAEYGITDRIQAGFAAFTAAHRIRKVPDLENRSGFAFDGLGISGKMQILEKDIDGPVGFAVAVEGEWHRRDETSGALGRYFGFGATAMADTVVVPNMLYIAANAGFEVERGREGGAPSETESSAFASAALSWRFTPRATLGAEARVESAFEGVFGAHEGTALFLGPTFFWKVSGKVSVSAAWSAQVAGSGEPGHRLNLDAFDRHRARVRIGLEF